MKKFRRQESASATNVFQFSLAGLILFSLTLIGFSSFVGYKLMANTRPKLAETFAVDPKDKSRSVHAGPWGELITRDIELGRPAEYLTSEVTVPVAETWTFTAMQPDAVKALLTKNGLSPAQVADVFERGTFNATTTNMVLTPSAKFLLSLDAKTRGQLYLGLTGLGVNTYIDNPYIFPSDHINSIYADAHLNPADVALLKKLIYENGSARQMSDYQFLLTQIPTVERRVEMARALSRQVAVFAGLVIRPDTDIDKLAQYWSTVSTVRIIDIRPLMRALKALPEGGNLSLFYVLPKFVRDRLYTYPLPPEPGEPVQNCHWSTFNFSSETPDGRFNDPAFAVPYIEKNYYRIAAPSEYGDLLLLVNSKNTIIHSAVYLAADIVFTKNGNSYSQPWMLMHIPDLLATYPATPPMNAIYLRHKTN